MPKGPKFKRGFTWRHYFDEWWDRRPQAWKARLFVIMGVMAVLASFVLYFWGHRWMEREAILAEAKRIHQSRIEASDKLMVPSSELPVMSISPQPDQIKIRPSE